MENQLRLKINWSMKIGYRFKLILMCKNFLSKIIFKYNLKWNMQKILTMDSTHIKVLEMGKVHSAHMMMEPKLAQIKNILCINVFKR